jgi:glycosyltransferase involved in cell wall biosynthesis
MNSPFVSVIIPTLNRQKLLISLLRDLLIQDYPAFEIIVVDQTQADYQPLIDLIEKHLDRIRYFRFRKEGLTSARNFGIKKSRGDILLFLDDDVKISKNFIRNHIRNYEDPIIGGVGGRVITQSAEKDPEVLAKMVGYIDKFGLLRGTHYNCPNRLEEKTTPRGCNMSFSRKAVEKVGGFDENFIGSCFREETDFSLSVLRKGFKLVFDPKPWVIHLYVPKGGARSHEKPFWYYEFFYNNAYFNFKWVKWYFWPIAFSSLFVPLVKFYLKHCRKLKYIFLPFKGVKDAYRRFSQSSFRRGQKAFI